MTLDGRLRRIEARVARAKREDRDSGQGRGRREKASPYAWARKYMRTERGALLDLEEHAYMREPLKLKDVPQLGLMCGSQVGKTTLAISRAFWFADAHPAVSVIYTMHTDYEVRKFSRARGKPAIESSPYLRERIGGIDSVELKTFAHDPAPSVIYFQGASETTQALSVPADLVVHDELDFSRPDCLRLYEDRLAHSSWAWRMVIGTPTVPGFGLAAIWEQSTQGEWFVKCRRCAWEGPLTWPESVTADAYVCPRGHVLSPATIRGGRWVHARADAEWRMYHIPRFLLPNWPADRVWEAHQREQFPSLFQNQIVGVPATSGELTLDEEIMACLVGRVAGQGQDEGPCFAGIDVGRDLHVVIAREEDEGRRAYLWVGKTDWAGLARLMELFHVRLAVIDALPETTKAQEFARAFPRRVKLAYYTTQPIKGDEPIKDYDDQARVDLDRTVTLDRSADRLILERDGFPALAHEDRQEFVSQMTAMVRGVQTDSAGLPRVFWREIRADHYRHAHNYATVAGDLLGARSAAIPAMPEGYRGIPGVPRIRAINASTGREEEVELRSYVHEPPDVVDSQRMDGGRKSVEDLYPPLRNLRKMRERRSR